MTERNEGQDKRIDVAAGIIPAIDKMTPEMELGFMYALAMLNHSAIFHDNAEGLPDGMMVVQKEVFDHTRDGIVVASLDGKIVAMNPSALKMFKYSSKEINDKNISELMPERERKAHEEGIARLNAGGERHIIGVAETIEVEGLTSDGIIFPIELSLEEKNGSLISIIRDITKRKQQEAENEMLRKELEKFSYRDHLTNLPNRRAFEEELNKFSKGRSEEIGTVFMFDLAKLHFINALGQSVGDEYLKKLAEILLSEFRVEDLVARIGGDEFAVFAKGMNEESIRNKIESINEEIAKTDLGYPDFPISIYMGVSSADNVRIHEARLEAERNMANDKKVKNQGKDSRDIQYLAP